MSTDIIAYKDITGEDRHKVLSEYSAENFTSVQGSSRFFNTVSDNVSVRTGFSRNDYEHFRPSERLPVNFKESVKACRYVYVQMEIVRNVIDLMTDFASENLKIVHHDKDVQTLFRVWAKKVNLYECVNEFIRHFLIDGNVVVKRTTGKLTKPIERDWMRRNVKASPDLNTKKEKKKLEKREIPWRYTFLNVMTLDWQGGELGKLVGEKTLVYNVPKKLTRELRNNTSPEFRGMRDKLPADLKRQLSNPNTKHVKLDTDKIFVTHSKKDSWDDWAVPFLVSVLKNLFFKEKLRQAEISALDGVINVIRLWKLGDHENGFLPNSAAFKKLSDTLEANTGGGAMDIIWDDMIDMQDYYPPVDKILGSEKYDQVNRDILIGLGVPEVLIGGSGGRFSNAWVQLKTLVEKLEYVRTKVIEWLDHEIKLFCDAMDIKDRPRIKFAQMNLQDENITRRLVVGLWDRGVISTEALLETYGEDFDLEMHRLPKEKQMLEKSGLEFNNPMKQKEQSNDSRTDEGGRPPDTKDAGRDERTPKPVTGNNQDKFIYALEVVDFIDKEITPIYIKDLGVQNARQLTSSQKREIDTLRRSIMSCINYGEKINKDNIITKLEANKINNECIQEMQAAIKNFTVQHKREPNATQKKRLEAIGWCSIQGE